MCIILCIVNCFCINFVFLSVVKSIWSNICIQLSSIWTQTTACDVNYYLTSSETGHNKSMQALVFILQTEQVCPFRFSPLSSNCFSI